MVLLQRNHKQSEQAFMFVSESHSSVRGACGNQGYGGKIQKASLACQLQGKISFWGEFPLTVQLSRIPKGGVSLLPCFFAARRALAVNQKTPAA